MSEAARPLLALFRAGLADERPPRRYWLGAACVVGSRLLDGAMVWLCGLLLDLVLVPYAIGAFGPLLAAYVLLVSAKGLVAFGEQALGERAGAWAQRALRERLLDAGGAAREDGQAASQLAVDLAAVERLVPAALLDTAGAVLRALVFLAILALLQWQLALATLLVVAGLWWLTGRLGTAGGRAQGAAGALAMAALGLALLVRGRLSPGGLLLTLAAAAQVAILLGRLAQAATLSRAAAPGAARLAARLRHQPLAVVAGARPRGAGATGDGAREPFVLVGLPLAILLAFLLGGIVQASDIRPALPFPGLRISRPQAAAQQQAPAGTTAAPPLAPGEPIWSATAGPRRAAPTTLAIPAATPIGVGVAADAPPASPSAAPSPSPGGTPTAISSTATATVASAVAAVPSPSPSPTPPPSATPASPPPATATAPPQPVPSAPPPPTATARPPAAPPPSPPPLPQPEPSPSAAPQPVPGPSEGGAGPSPSPSSSPLPSPPSSPSPSPGDDDHGGPSSPGPTPSPRPSPSPSPSPSPGGNSGPSSPSPSPSPEPSPTARPPSPNPSPSASPSPPPPSPTPRPSRDDDPSPKPSRSP